MTFINKDVILLGVDGKMQVVLDSLPRKVENHRSTEQVFHAQCTALLQTRNG